LLWILFLFQIIPQSADTRCEKQVLGKWIGRLPSQVLASGHSSWHTDRRERYNCKGSDRQNCPITGRKEQKGFNEPEESREKVMQRLAHLHRLRKRSSTSSLHIVSTRWCDGSSPMVHLVILRKERTIKRG